MRATRRIFSIVLNGVLWTATGIWLSALSEAASITEVPHPAPVLAMLDSVVVVALVLIAAIVFFVKRAKKKEREYALDAAWHEVLNDPHYMKRRYSEEIKQLVKKQGELASLND